MSRAAVPAGEARRKTGLVLNPRKRTIGVLRCLGAGKAQPDRIPGDQQVCGGREDRLNWGARVTD